jgi:hypothetical protein
LGPWLARLGKNAELQQTRRIFVRELCRRDGKLVGAIACGRTVPLHGVLTVVPFGISPNVLVAILNSAYVAEYLRSHAASFAKVDFQKVTVSELRELPIPISAIQPSWRATLDVPLASDLEAAQRDRLMRLAKSAGRIGATKIIPSTTYAQINEILFRMYENE